MKAEKTAFNIFNGIGENYINGVSSGENFYEYPAIRAFVTFSGDTTYVQSEAFFGQLHNTIRKYRVPHYNNAAWVELDKVKSILFSKSCL